MLTESEAINLASTPHLIADSATCNTIIGYLNVEITRMDGEEFELEVVSQNYRAMLLQQEDKTIALSDAEWRTSAPYRKWKQQQLTLRKYRNWRNALRKKEEKLLDIEKYSRNLPVYRG